MRLLQKLAALVAILFGVVTVIAGGGVLLGVEPGYVVFLPLLLYNTTMGLAYVGAGVMIWRDVTRGRQLAAVIAALNLAVLVAIVVLHRTGAAVAADSVRAMTFRTVVWIVLFLLTSWLHASRDDPHAGLGT